MASSRIEIDGITLNYAMSGPAAAPVVVSITALPAITGIGTRTLPRSRVPRFAPRCPWPWRERKAAGAVLA